MLNEQICGPQEQHTLLSQNNERLVNNNPVQSVFSKPGKSSLHSSLIMYCTLGVFFLFFYKQTLGFDDVFPPQLRHISAR